MCEGYAIDVEQVVGGFINVHEDGEYFVLQDVYDYISSLWNAGCGPIRLNFTRPEMVKYLDRCNGICLDVCNTRRIYYTGKRDGKKRWINEFNYGIYYVTERGIIEGEAANYYQWRINKSYLEPLPENVKEERNFFRNYNKAMAISFDLFCRLQIDLRTPRNLLDTMGFGFIHRQ